VVRALFAGVVVQPVGRWAGHVLAELRPDRDIWAALNDLRYACLDDAWYGRRAG
jgi:hypothetical protein